MLILFICAAQANLLSLKQQGDSKKGAWKGGKKERDRILMKTPLVEGKGAAYSCSCVQLRSERESKSNDI